MGQEDIHPGLLFALLVAGHITAAIILTIAFGACLSMFLVAAAVLIELGVWQWRKLGPQIGEAVKYHSERSLNLARFQEFLGNDSPKIADSDSATSPVSSSAPIQSKETNSAPKLQTVESTKAATPPPHGAVASEAVVVPLKSRESTTVQSIPQKPGFSLSNFFISPVSRRGGHTLNEQGANLRPGAGDFFGRGTTLNLGRFALSEPLVYVTAGLPSFKAPDASLIDGSLPIAPPGANPKDRLPYWPSYAEATSQQRAKYLDWLAGGRRDPAIELGYVFIYFYGLERRVLIDGADHLPIIEEVLRLRTIYRDSRSFDRYSASLLWITVALAGRLGGLTDQLFRSAISSTSKWDEQLLAQCLAYFQERSLPLPVDVAFLAAQLDPRTPSSVVVRRQETRFKELFAKRYYDRFGNGVLLKSAKRSRPVHYHAASATLNQSQLAGQFSRSLLELPDVLGISSQFKPLLEIWEQCIEELRAFDKVSRTGKGPLSADAFEALPSELRIGEHPETDQWIQLWADRSSSNGLPVVPVAALAALKGFEQRTTLLKSQCDRLLSTADCLAIGVEPDARLTGKNYRWDDNVVLFERESVERSNAATYQAAALLLELGVHIAAADDKVDEEELAIIAKQLEDQFTLTADEVKRFQCRRQLLCLNPPKEARVSAAIRKKLGKQQRRLIGEFLVGIAAADQVITSGEMASLRRLYSQLELDAADLDKLLAPLATAKPIEAPKQTVVAKPEEFRLDLRAVSRIMDETKEVARILQDAMDVEDEPEISSAPLASTLTLSTATLRPASESTAVIDRAAILNAEHSADASLDIRYQPFFRALLTKPAWTITEARELAKSHHVMLNGAIESINEWSQEQFGDWLIEEGDQLVIHSHILRK
ncbi:tellurite resistance TerB family protein [Anatilimnocola floriformis]|uniref:tellurite resistance TerB family protein n=1 Tax=Anatilimnocola floriformis TaxID=2948575 RepID=UPI0020C3D13E|nr:TerB N-terminal domain-containing protein [Anatilimnocola floriformis]